MAQTTAMIPEDRLEQISQRFQYLEAAMAAGSGDIAELAREYSELRPVVEQIGLWRGVRDDMAEAEALLDDPDMKALAEEELPILRARLPEVEKALQIALLPKDAADVRPAMLEIRPGTGGDEAALFAADLLRMYQRYADTRGWRFDIIDEQATELGGIKEVTAHVQGEGVFARLKYESGVHRVQRVPATESQGRIHTSACTVAVLAAAEDAGDIEIRNEDLRIDTYRSSGAGGQHVNTTDSAVRLTHLPTGVVVECQDERSQHKNKAKAMSLLKARLLDARETAAHAEQAAERKSMVGSGDRSERIRTYNFPQGRLTDHRINLTLYRLNEIVAGDLDEVIGALLSEHQAGQLAALADGQG